MLLNEKLRNLRKRKNISVYKLSNLTDISANYIHAVERGDNQPSIYILERILACLDYNLAEFFSEDSEIMYPSDFERKLIETVRFIDGDKSRLILELAKVIAENSKTSPK